MKTFIIDGYNVIKTQSALFGKINGLEKQREHLLKLIKSRPGFTDKSITVVFDGDPDVKAPRKQHFRGVKVLFSGRGRKADLVIQQTIRKSEHPGDLTVVTSDREIQYTAKDHGAEVMSAAHFSRQLQSPVKSPAHQSQAPEPNSELSDKEVAEWMKLFKKHRSSDDED